MKDPYYDLPEVSNSDLGKLKDELFGARRFDPTQAYRFGSLVDILITEPDKANYLTREAGGESYSKDEWDLAVQMKQAFKNDEFSSKILQLSTMQKVTRVPAFKIQHRGYSFTLPVRCKWDLFINDMGWGGDIKSTVATTQDQFLNACYHFDYNRQRAWYMDLVGAEKDVLIGISKKNLKVFKIFIDRDSEFYKSGREQYQELAFLYYTLFSEL